MSSETETLAAPASPSSSAARAGISPRLRAGIVLISLFWLAFAAVGAIEKPYFYGFLYSMAAPALLVLLYSIWWWFNRTIPFADRVFGCFAVIILGLAIAPLCHPSIAFALPTLGLPVALTILTLWLLVVRWTGFPWKRLGLLVLLTLGWGIWTSVRSDGVNADLQATTRWRWMPTPEQEFLAEKAQSGQLTALNPGTATSSPLTLSPGDWPSFRGVDREGVMPGVRMATDWTKAPPKLVWRRRVGPAWSSVIVIGDRLFTQEQRGDQETVVCYEASTGKEVWVHADPARFWEAVSGAGPRATPTFSGSRLYTLGATGILNCLDAATGNRYWSHDVATEAPAKPPMWGYASSPLIVDDKVIVFAGGQSDRNLLAYRTDTGAPAWTAPGSHDSYASPQLATIGGTRQCLHLGDHGLTAVDPATGKLLWQYGWVMEGAPRTVQTHVLSASHLTTGTLTGPGVARVEVTLAGDQWKVAEIWSTSQMKPEFPDFVVHQGAAYGFDGAVFCCLDLASGKRRWKEGRYGRGQVLLLPEQAQLLVTSEQGEVLLLAADPERHRELGRFRALDSKTWNHPVICRGRLYLRNDIEMACFELSEDTSKSPR